METTPGICSVVEECLAGTHSCADPWALRVVRYVLLGAIASVSLPPPSRSRTGEVLWLSTKASSFYRTRGASQMQRWTHRKEVKKKPYLVSNFRVLFPRCSEPAGLCGRCDSWLAARSPLRPCPVLRSRCLGQALRCPLKGGCSSRVLNLMAVQFSSDAVL